MQTLNKIKVNKYIKISENRLPDFQEFINKKKDDLTFVEFGVGSGLTIQGIKKKYPNSKTYGFDISPINNRLKIIKQDLNCFEFVKYQDILKNADIFILLDVLEHINEPMAFLRNLTKFTKKNAVIVISCPNFSSIRMLFAWIKGTLPKKENGYFDKTHLHWFTPASFSDFFKNLNPNNISIKYLFSKKIRIKLIQRICPKRLCSQFIFVAKI
jgi:2-polyprenyl-3-methyl-5-hydroxy-6-metoxy-1,4-benzoquinol methylase